MNHRTVLIAGAFALLAALSASARDDDGKITEGRLDALGADGKPLGPCPLKHTSVDTEISGMVARVSVTQQFHNPFKEKIEAVYVFPLHQDSAVDEMTMKVGDRVVKGLIKEKGEAKRIYEQAKARGHVASLLDQERPNIFTQSVANIEPGEQVTITIRYSQTMNWEDGRFEFDFPTVVGPRYIPGASKAAPDAVGGPDKMPSFFHTPDDADAERKPGDGPPVVNPNPAPPTDEVPDAGRITPPVVEEGYRAGHNLSITVRINAGRPILDLKSALHEVETDHPGGDETRALVTLAEKAMIPNRDFAISYRTAGETISDSLLTHTDERGNFFTLILQPPARVKPEEIVPRELVFVLDTSGSMHGFPMETSKALMRRTIKNLRPADRFNIVTFAGSTAVLFDKPVANTAKNRQKALRFIDTLQGAGGTEMMKAINVALGGEHDPKSVRIVCFLTDGYIGNDMAIIGAVKKHARTTRVFSFGIGTSVNRFLMDSMARAGRGESRFVMRHDQAKMTADKFYQRIDAPVLTDIELDFGTLDVEDVYPQRIEDLFAAKPVVVKGRYKNPGDGTITLKGVNATGPYERKLTVSLPAKNPDNAVLASQWARARIGNLMMRDMPGLQRGEMEKSLKKEILGLGLAYHLMTPFTSFVAVEELRITEGGKARTISVPVEMPEGVSYSGVFGDRSKRGMMKPRIVGASMTLGGGFGSRTRGYANGSPGGRSDKMREMDAEEHSVRRLEQLERAGKLTDAEKRAKLLPLKLDEALVKLAAKGGSDPVEVRVVLRDVSDETIEKLEALGFKVLAKATAVKLVIGTVPADQLEALALLDVVRRVDPAD